MLPYPYWISFRYFRFQGRKTFISLITLISVAGVAVGVMALIVVMSVMSGFDRELKDKFLGVYGHVVVSARGLISDYPEVEEKIRTVPRVTALAPYVGGQVIIRTRRQALGVNLRGIDPRREIEVTKLGKYLEAGSLDLGPDGIVIGSQLASLCRLCLGDRVILISPAETLLPGAAGAKRKKCTVVGIFKSGMAQYDLELAYVSLAAAQDLFNLGDRVNGISIKIDDVEYAHDVRNRIAKILPVPPYYVRSWMELNKPLFSAIQVEKNLMFIIVALITVVASFNIASTLIVTVKEKTKAIGIFKSLGMKEAAIRKIFTLQGLLIGLVGVLLGVAAGLLLIANINHISRFISRNFGIEVFPPDVYYFDSIPARVNVPEILIIVGCAMAISIIASLYPAWKASRLDAVQTLRYE